MAIRNLLGVCTSQVVQDNNWVGNAGKWSAWNNLIIVLVLARSFWAIAFVSHAALQRPSSHGKVVGSPWHHSWNLKTNSALRGQKWWGRKRVKILSEFLSKMCNVKSKLRAVSCYCCIMLLAVSYFLVMMQCMGRRDGEVELGKMPTVWINSFLLSSQCCSIFFSRWLRSFWRLRMKQWWK